MYIEEAEEMLAAASPWPWNHRLEPRGDGPGVYKVGNAGHDIALIANTVFEDEQKANAALLSFSPATLAVLILAVRALKPARCQGCTETATCKRCEALAAWRAL